MVVVCENPTSPSGKKFHGKLLLGSVSLSETALAIYGNFVIFVSFRTIFKYSTSGKTG